MGFVFETSAPHGCKSEFRHSLRRGLEWSGDYGLDYLEYLRTVCEARLSIRAIRFRNFSSAWGVLFLNRQRRRTISALLASRPGVEWRLRIRLSRVFTDSMRSQIEYSGNSFSKLQLRMGSPFPQQTKATDDFGTPCVEAWSGVAITD